MCRKIQALALQRMLEEDLYFCILYCYWQRDDYFYKVFAPRIFAHLPGPIYPAIIRLVRASVLRDLYGQVCSSSLPPLHAAVAKMLQIQPFMNQCMLAVRGLAVVMGVACCSCIY
jgi:hypothetical protein